MELPKHGESVGVVCLGIHHVLYRYHPLGSGGGGAPNGPVLALARVAKGAMAPAAGAG